MKYTIQEDYGVPHLYRHDVISQWNNGVPTNAEFEMWQEIQRLRSVLERIRDEERPNDEEPSFLAEKALK